MLFKRIPSNRLGSVLVLLALGIVCASQPPDERDANRHASSTTTPTPSSTSEPGHGLILPVTTAFPDPLGMSLVSGFYGPGAWAGWFLAAVASFVRLYHKPHAKMDPNTWLFLLGTNWAAIDFFRHVHLISGEGSTAELEKGAGIIGASLSITFWGNTYSFYQLLAILKMNINIREAHVSPDLPVQRLVTLFIGFILSGTAQTMPIFMDNAPKDAELSYIGGIVLARVPFLYIMGDRNRDAWRLMAAMMGFASLQLSVVALTGIALRYVYIHCKRVRAAVDQLKRQLEKRKKILKRPYSDWYALIIPVMLLVFVLLVATEASTRLKLIFITLNFPITVLMVAGFMSVWVLGVFATSPVALMVYVFVMLESRFRAFYGTCFFMPCAPQSIMDWDQAYSLVVGIVLLLGVECAPAVLKYRKERKAFEQDIERRLAEGHQRRDERNASRNSMDITSMRSPGSSNIELQNLAQDNNEPDAPLPLSTENRATLHTPFAEPEEEFGAFENSDNSVSQLRLPVDQRYMMSGGRSGAGSGSGQEDVP